MFGFLSLAQSEKFCETLHKTIGKYTLQMYIANKFHDNIATLKAECLELVDFFNKNAGELKSWRVGELCGELFKSITITSHIGLDKLS